MTDLYADATVDAETAYDVVIGTIRANTGGPEKDVSAAVHRRTVFTSCAAHGQLEPAMVRRELNRAMDNGDVLCYRDSTGEYQFTLRRDDRLLGLIDEWRDSRHPESADQMLLELIETVGGDDDVSDDVIGEANAARQALRDRDEE